MQYLTIVILIVSVCSLSFAQTPSDTSILIQLYAGWNIVSLPVQVTDSSITTLFPAAVSKAFTYEDGYQGYNFLERGKGYWIKVASDMEVAISGKIVTEDTIEIVKGWSLLGTITSRVDTEKIETIPSGIIIKIFGMMWGDCPGPNPWPPCEPQTLKPGRGYWIKTSSAGKIILKSN